MSQRNEKRIESTVAGIEFVTTVQPNRVLPAWLPEALLLGEWWRSTGLLEQLQQQVRVSRGRMGQYEVCDFVLLLLAYAVSGEASLAVFFQALNPVKHLLMAVWGRARCPVASTLSRFLEAVEDGALESLRQLFEHNLLQQSLPVASNGGLYDRRGDRFWVFDLDGTHEATRQRSLPTTAEYPDLHRRSSKACAPGLLGRKRGQVVRTRSALQQAHTSEWLATFGSPGNGTAQLDLGRACTVIGQYIQQHGINAAAAIVRLDGYYGVPAFVNVVQHHQFDYLLRGRDYQILNYPTVQAKLAQTPAQRWQHPETKVAREVFELGFLDDCWSGYTQPIRVVVMRSPLKPDQKPRIGIRMGDYAYELVLTSIPVHALNAVDIVSLYLGRGGFEKSLADEDVEGDCDRWCSWHPYGQEFWQILAQWVWNWRVWVGWKQHPESLRRTLWQPAIEEDALEPEPPVEPQPQPTSLGATRTHPPFDDTPSEQYAPMQVVESWARSNGKFAGNDFTLESERSLRCPAGHSMYRREVRRNGRGEWLLIFSMARRTCLQCPLRERCVANGSAMTNGRRITVIRRKLLDHPAPSGNNTPPPSRCISVSRVKTIHPVIWEDLPAAFLRRDLRQNLRQHQFEFDSMISPTEKQQPFLLSRDQRAHRRISWSERLARNALDPQGQSWKVRLFGISSTLATFVKDLKKTSLSTEQST